MPASADDDVVVHGDAERRGDIDDRAGHLDIRLRWRRTAGGMVVHEAIVRPIRLNAQQFLKPARKLGTCTGDCKR